MSYCIKQLQVSSHLPHRKKFTYKTLISSEIGYPTHGTGLNPVGVINSRSGCLYVMHLLSSKAKRPNLEMKTRP
jgi:hypothetical protein